MSFLLNLLGFVALISGLAWIATSLGVSPTYVTASALVLLGMGVASAFLRARIG